MLSAAVAEFKMDNGLHLKPRRCLEEENDVRERHHHR